MLTIRERASARAGLAGNPSDGFGGQTLSVEVPNYFAEVVLYEWSHIEILPGRGDDHRFLSLGELAEQVEHHGYYGGVRLAKAAVKRFAEFCGNLARQGRREYQLHAKNFSIRYETNIPRQVGLGGSSAIVLATLRALMKFYEVSIHPRVLASLALSVEQDELGIPGGLQDRAIQAFGGLLFMDFGPAAMESIDGLECGRYAPLDPARLPPLYLAFARKCSEPTEAFHRPLRSRFEKGESLVAETLQQIASCAATMRMALESGDRARFNQVIDRNFDLRAQMAPLPQAYAAMVAAARSCGASAKFAGSGGAIVGSFENSSQFAQLEQRLEALDCGVIRLPPLATAQSTTGAAAKPATTP